MGLVGVLPQFEVLAAGLLPDLGGGLVEKGQKIGHGLGAKRQANNADKHGRWVGKDKRRQRRWPWQK